MQTFSGWVSLPENRSARTAVERVARAIRQRRPCVTHNPLCLHGPAGTGKTHLVNALIAEVTRAVPDLLVTAVAAREFAPCCNVPGSPELPLDEPLSTERTRAADLVVVEDLQFLPAAATEACVQLVDQCRARRRQLIVTAAVGPAQLDQLPGRLWTRLSAGLVVRLSPLSPSSRLLFVRDRAQCRGLNVGADVLDWLATHIPGSARQLEGALAKVETLVGLSGTPLTPDALAEYFRADLDPRRLTVEHIAQRVGSHFRVDPTQMRSAARGRHAVVPRHVGMYLARRLTSLSLQEIGSYFGGRDHTSVMHACRKVEESLTRDASLYGAVSQMEADLR
jgi:chromosomal replication initiator protein